MLATPLYILSENMPSGNYLKSSVCTKCCSVSESDCILNKRHSFWRADGRNPLPAP